jgi:hypothetical protein
MSPSGDPFSDDLDSIAARLRASRPEADPIELDQIKQRVLDRRSTTRPGRSTFMGSKIATVATLVALIAGTGGAVAVAGHGHSKGSAASGEYRPGKGCGDRNHQHSGCPPNPTTSVARSHHHGHHNDD